MNRRDLLRAGAVAGAGALAGCTVRRLQEAERKPPTFEPIPAEDIDLPVRQRLGVAEAAIERAEGAEIESLDELAAYLVGEGIRVETLEEIVVEGTPLLELEYVVEVQVDEGLMHHLGIVAGGYASLVAATHDSEALEAHLLDPVGEAFGEYEVRRAWAEKYDRGVYTARKYAAEVLVTAEST